MSCQPSQLDRLMADVTSRVRELERGMADYRALAGIPATPEERAGRT